jgi:hypothetical protein
VIHVTSSDGCTKDGTETQLLSRTHARGNSQWQQTPQGSRAPTLLACYRMIPRSGSTVAAWSGGVVRVASFNGRTNDGTIEKGRQNELSRSANAAGEPCANPACLRPYDPKVVNFTGSGTERRCPACDQFRRSHKGRDRNATTIENTRRRELTSSANAAGEPCANPACLMAYDPKLGFYGSGTERRCPTCRRHQLRYPGTERRP